MKTMIPLVMLLLSYAANSFAQGDLQFNQVINITPGQTYTVPEGKVLKVESIPFNNAIITANFAGLISSGGSLACTYSSSVFLTIGNVQITGTAPNTGIFAGGQCDSGCQCTRTAPATIPALDFPIWLNAGKVISVGSNVSGVFVSGIEFNVIP